MWRVLLSAHYNMTCYSHSDSPRLSRLDSPEQMMKLMNIVLFAYMVPEVFYIHKHCLTKRHECSVLASIIMGFCTSLTSNLADLDERGWQCSHVTGVIFLFCLPSLFPFPHPPLLSAHITIEFLHRAAPLDKNHWVMTVEVDMPKWS